jgi:hypothetical protein
MSGDRDLASKSNIQGDYEDEYRVRVLAKFDENGKGTEGIHCSGPTTWRQDRRYHCSALKRMSGIKKAGN